MQQNEYTRNPGAALTRFVVLALAAALFWWVAEQGLQGAWIGVYILGVFALAAFFGIFRAHRAWKEAQDLARKAHESSGRYDTRADRRAGPPPDGWE